jgi:hypothetical protein
MIKAAALIVGTLSLFAFQAPAIAGDVVTARPLHAQLIAPPTFAAYADASRLVVPAQPVAKAETIAARPLHAQLIAAPSFAAYADASKLRVRTDAEIASLPQ